MSAVLYHLPYSAWSHRTRQALALEGIGYRAVVYVPTVGEPGLRWRARRWSGPVHVPVLIPEDGVARMDSTEIAAWASSRGRAGLLPEAHREAIEEVVELSERVLNIGRVRATRRILADPQALRESLPPGLSWLGPAGVPIAAQVARGLLRKYGGGVPGEVDAALEEAVRVLADRVGGARHLVDGRLTWADLAAASALTFVRPSASMPLGPRTRAAFCHDALASRFAALVDWRDRIDEQAAVAG